MLVKGKGEMRDLGRASSQAAQLDHRHRRHQRHGPRESQEGGFIDALCPDQAEQRAEALFRACRAARCRGEGGEAARQRRCSSLMKRRKGIIHHPCRKQRCRLVVTRKVAPRLVVPWWLVISWRVPVHPRWPAAFERKRGSGDHTDTPGNSQHGGSPGPNDRTRSGILPSPLAQCCAARAAWERPTIQAVAAAPGCHTPQKGRQTSDRQPRAERAMARAITARQCRSFYSSE